MAATEKNIENVELNKDVIDELSDASDIEITYFYDSRMNEGGPLCSTTSSNTKDTVLSSGFLDSEAGPSSIVKEESSHEPPANDISEEESNKIKNKLNAKKFRQLIILRNKLYERAKQLGEREVNFDNEEEEESLVFEEIHVQQMILRLEKSIYKARERDNSTEMLTVLKCASLPPIIISNSGNSNIDKKLTELLESKRGPCMPIISHDEVKDICKIVRDEELINDKKTGIPEASDEYLFPSYVTHLTALISKTIRGIAYNEDLKHYSEFLPEEEEEEDISTNEEGEQEGHALTKVLKMISDGGIENITNNEAENLIDEVCLDSDEDEDEEELEYESEDERLSGIKEEQMNESADSAMEEDEPVNEDVDCPMEEQEQIEKVLNSPIAETEQVKNVLDSPITSDEQVKQVSDSTMKENEQVKQVPNSIMKESEQVKQVSDSTMKGTERVKNVLDSLITSDEQVKQVSDSTMNVNEQAKQVLDSEIKESEQVKQVLDSEIKESEQVKQVLDSTRKDDQQVMTSTEEPMIEGVNVQSKEEAQKGQEEGNEKQLEKVEQKEEQTEEQEGGERGEEENVMNEEGSVKTEILDDEARAKLQRENNAENPKVFYNMSDFLKQQKETENDDIKVECVVGGFTTGGMTFSEEQKLHGVKLWLRNNDFPSNPNPSQHEVIEGPSVKRLRAECLTPVENAISNTVSNTGRDLIHHDDNTSSKSLEIICCIRPRKVPHQATDMELDGASQSRDSIEVVHEVNPRTVKRNQLIISEELLENAEHGIKRKSDSSVSSRNDRSSSSGSGDIEILPSSKCRRILTVEDLNKRREAYKNQSNKSINNAKDEKAPASPHNNSVVDPSLIAVAPPSISNPSPPSNVPYGNQVPELSFLPVYEPQSEPIPTLPIPDDDIIILD